MKNPKDRKRLTANQSELVATYLPQTLQKNRKLTSAVKLVLANIYQLHYLQKNWGKRTVFRSREDFMNDIDAKFKEDVIRPQAKLIELDLVYIRSGVRGRATEYTLNDELYELLPTQIKGYISEKFKGAFLPKLRGTLKCDNELIDSEISDVVSENTISAPLNSVNNSDLQHLSVPSESESLHYSDNNSIISKSINKKKNSILRNSIKEKKLKRKESGASGQGIHSEERLSDFDLSNELNTSMQSEGEQDRQGFNETVTLSSKDTGKNFGLHTFQELMELDDVTEDTSTSSERIDKSYTQHTSKMNTSKEIKDSQSMGDGVTLHPMEKRSEKLESFAATATADKVMTKEMATAIIDNLGEYYSEGASIMEHQPHKFMIGLAHEIPFMDLTNIVPNYIMGQGFNIGDLCIIRNDDGKLCGEFEMYFNN